MQIIIVYKLLTCSVLFSLLVILLYYLSFSLNNLSFSNFNFLALSARTLFSEYFCLTNASKPRCQPRCFIRGVDACPFLSILSFSFVSLYSSVWFFFFKLTHSFPPFPLPLLSFSSSVYLSLSLSASFSCNPIFYLSFSQTVFFLQFIIYLAYLSICTCTCAYSLI